MKSLEDYLKLPYTIETKKESDGSYFIKVKELPGCMSVGESIEEAYAMIEDAKTIWIQSYLDAGREVPEPEEDDVKAYSGKFMVRISPRLHSELSETAFEFGVSLNYLVSEILSQNNGIVKIQKQMIDDLLNKVSFVPALTVEKHGAFEKPRRAEQWVYKGNNFRGNSTQIILNLTKENQKKAT